MCILLSLRVYIIFIWLRNSLMMVQSETDHVLRWQEILSFTVPLSETRDCLERLRLESDIYSYYSPPSFPMTLFLTQISAHISQFHTLFARCTASAYVIFQSRKLFSIDDNSILYRLSQSNLDFKRLSLLPIQLIMEGRDILFISFLNSVKTSYVY